MRCLSRAILPAALPTAPSTLPFLRQFIFCSSSPSSGSIAPPPTATPSSWQCFPSPPFSPPPFSRWTPISFSYSSSTSSSASPRSSAWKSDAPPSARSSPRSTLNHHANENFTARCRSLPQRRTRRPLLRLHALFLLATLQCRLFCPHRLPALAHDRLHR